MNSKIKFVLAEYNATRTAIALLPDEFSDHSKVAQLLELVDFLYKLSMLWTMELVLDVLSKQILIKFL